VSGVVAMAPAIPHISVFAYFYDVGSEVDAAALRSNYGFLASTISDV
jgi:hypothetical protein